MLKATSVNETGAESFPTSLEVNESGYVLLPEDPEAVAYRLYAPLEGFEEHGPWYLKRVYSRSEAKRARFTVVGLYEQRDLVPMLCPPTHRGFIQLPTPQPGQEFWHVYGGPPNYTPYAIVKCPETPEVKESNYVH